MRFFRILGLTAVLAISCVAHAADDTSSSSKNKLVVYFIDVGMGDALFLDMPPNDSMLIDAGSWDGAGIENLMGFLEEFFSDPDRENYKRTISLVVATHQHKDHIEGMKSVLKDFKVGTYIDNGVGTACKGKKKSLTCDVEKLANQAKHHIHLTEKMIETDGKQGVFSDGILDPFDAIDVFALGATPKTASKNENNNSIVLKIVFGKQSFLLQGDAEKEEERRIIERLKAANNLAVLDASVLKIGHHGSDTASTKEFLDLVTPEVGVVSVGLAKNSPKTKQFRLPKESVVRRLTETVSGRLQEQWEVEVFPDKKKGGKIAKPKIFGSNAELFFTSADGSIKMATDGEKLNSEILEASGD